MSKYKCPHCRFINEYQKVCLGANKDILKRLGIIKPQIVTLGEGISQGSNAQSDSI